MFIYFAIFLLVTVLAFAYVKGPDSVVWRGGVLLAVFLVLFLPAALRYGIGTDYFMYIDAIEEFRDTGECIMERSFEWICDLCSLLGDAPQYVIAFYAFFTCLASVLALKRSGFYISLPIYVLVIYPCSFNIMRQELAVALLMLAFAFYLSRCWKGVMACACVAVLAHSSAFVFLPILCAGRLMTHMRVIAFVAMFVVAAIALAFCNLADFLLSAVSFFGKYASYATQEQYMAAAQVDSGLGFWLRVLIMTFLFIALSLCGRGGRSRIMAVFCGFSIVFSMVGLHLEIFRRFIYITDLVVPFAVAELCMASRAQIRLAGVLVYCGFVVLFSHGICAEWFGKSVPNEIVPYRMISVSSGDLGI